MKLSSSSGGKFFIAFCIIYLVFYAFSQAFVGVSPLWHFTFSPAGSLGLLPSLISQLPLSGWQNSAQVSMAFIDIVESVDL